MGVDPHERSRVNGQADWHPAVIATWKNRDRARPSEVRSAKIIAWRKRKAREKDYRRRYLGDNT